MWVIESGKTTRNLSDERIADIVDEVETIIRPLLLNLLSNACKYTPNGGRIVFSVTELAQRSPQFVNLRFVVSDNGYGMTREYAAIIFDVFTREVNSVN